MEMVVSNEAVAVLSPGVRIWGYIEGSVAVPDLGWENLTTLTLVPSFATYQTNETTYDNWQARSYYQN